jgi:hypothetical protein
MKNMHYFGMKNPSLKKIIFVIVTIIFLQTIDSTVLAAPPAKSSKAAENTFLARPSDVDIGKTVREEDINSELGRIKIRWPRSVETFFGRTPLRAMADAARTVKRAISKGSFPSELQKLNMPWQVVFMDADLPETQIPSYLVSNCHPGWMTPPSNIYIVGQRIAGGCSASARNRHGVADEELAEVLIHEIGHAVEFQLLKNSNAYGDRMRAEGFATWFETYAARSSSLLSPKKIEDRILSFAKASYRQQPNTFSFQGSAEDYSRASMIFKTLEERKGIAAVMQVYELVNNQKSSFAEAYQKVSGWDQKRLDEEAIKFLNDR